MYFSRLRATFVRAGPEPAELPPEHRVAEATRERLSHIPRVSTPTGRKAHGPGQYDQRTEQGSGGSGLQRGPAPAAAVGGRLACRSRSQKRSRSRVSVGESATSSW